VICGCCGSLFGRKVWNSTNERLRRIVWRCNKKYETKGKKECINRHIDDRVLYEGFISAFNAVVENKDYFIEKRISMKDSEDFLKRYRTREFIKIIENTEKIDEFDIDLYFKLVEKIQYLMKVRL
jgi:site-specific DNA recombinase